MAEKFYGSVGALGRLIWSWIRPGSVDIYTSCIRLEIEIVPIAILRLAVLSKIEASHYSGIEKGAASTVDMEA